MTPTAVLNSQNGGADILVCLCLPVFSSSACRLLPTAY